LNRNLRSSALKKPQPGVWLLSLAKKQEIFTKVD